MVAIALFHKPSCSIPENIYVCLFEVKMYKSR